jgi:CrcB protein
LVVAAGGAVGALVRHLLEERFPAPVDGLPWTTLSINVTGSFLLALLPALALVRRHPLLPPMLGPGVLGGFTTLSAYSEQVRRLLDGGRTTTGLVYLFGTLAACLVAVAAADLVSTPTERAEFESEDGDL